MGTVSEQVSRGRAFRLFCVALLVVLTFVTACDAAPAPESGLTTTTSPPPTLPAFAPEEPEEQGPLLAFRAVDEIALVDGTTVVGSAPGTFTPSNDPIATDDGRFVFARTADNNIVTIDVETKESATHRVAADSAIGTAEGSTVVWLEQPDRLMQLDLANPDAGPTLRRTLDLPTEPGAEVGDAALLAARGGTVIITRVESTPSPYGGPDTLYAIRGTGAPTLLGEAPANSPVSVARLSPDGARLAYALYQRTATNCGTAGVAVSDADGTQHTFEVADADPNAGSQVLNLWWPPDGPPRLSLVRWRCDQPGTLSPLVWELGDDQLVQATPPAAALRIAQVAPGQQAAIIPQDTTSPSQAGTLVFEDSGRRIPIRADVDALAVITPQPPG